MEEVEDGVEGNSNKELVLGGGTLRKGDDGLLRRLDDAMATVGPSTGELHSSAVGLFSTSRTLVRTGDVMGKISSAGFFGARMRLGEPEWEGLAGRGS